MSYYLALDAGGTKTDYVLADETHELARTRTGTIKRMRADESTACANLEQGLQALTAQTGIAMSAITRTCVGMAGERVPLVADWLRTSIHARVAGELLLLGDVEIALDAAFPGGAGVLVLAGTGSNVAGRTPDGKIMTAGGWGPALAEQGSGYRIGQEALRALFLALDEDRSTLLLPAVLKFWQLDSIDALVAYANSLPSPDFSSLVGTVLHCANQGDVVATATLSQQGEELGYLVRLLIDRLKRSSSQSGWDPPIAFAGSIMKNVAPVREALVATVLSSFPRTQMTKDTVDPIAGALWRARQTS